MGARGVKPLENDYANPEGRKNSIDKFYDNYIPFVVISGEN